MVEKRVSEVGGKASVKPVQQNVEFDYFAIRAQAERLRSQELGALIRPAGKALADGVRALWRRLGEGWQRRATLAELARLDDRILSDIGLARDQLGVTHRKAL
ncbi:MAG: DUF1127 domain-containing protein [Minwuiales bacterium]|nr:DUF1127 domain-containing protein [Minwuiales bacterium]